MLADQSGMMMTTSIGKRVSASPTRHPSQNRNLPRRTRWGSKFWTIGECEGYGESPPSPDHSYEK